MPCTKLSPARRPASTLARFRADPIAFLRHAAAEGGPTTEFRIGRRSLVLLSEPSLIEELLVTRQASFRKGPGLLRTRPLLGDGLLTSDGVRHHRHRRQLQPAFKGARIAPYAEEMARHAGESASAWQAGETRDIHVEMMRLTLKIVGATLFASSRPADPVAVAAGVAEALQALYRPLSACPHAAAGNVDHANKTLTEAVETLIAGHAPGPGAATDVLSLLQASDRTPGEQQDEAMTFLLAGHESVANALTWTWYALSQHDTVRARFEAEIDQAGSAPLPYTRRIIAESLRLYPPAWMVSREAREDVPLGGRTWAAGTVMIAAPCVTHVDARFWINPEHFDPDRWSAAAQTANPCPRFAFFPFGGGARRCIGEQFAVMEMATVLSTIGRRWRFDPPVGAPAPRREPLVTLRPAGGLPMVLSLRP